MNRRKFTQLGFQAADSVVLIASVYLAANLSVAPSERFLPPGEVDDFLQPLRIFSVAVLLVVWQVLFTSFGLYRQRHMSFMSFRRYRILDLVKATTLGTLLLVGAAFLGELPDINVGFVVVFWSTNTVGTLLVREVLITFLRQLRIHGRNLRYLLIVGTNDRAMEFAARVEREPELGYRLRGFIDDEWRSIEGRKKFGSKLVAKLSDVNEYLRGTVVDEVVIVLPVATLYEEASRIVKICEEHGVVVHFVPGFDFLNMGSSRAGFGLLHDEPIITLLPPPMSGWSLVFKRSIDFAGAAILLLLLSPLLIAVAAAVKITSPGPIMFVQERLGINKRKFRLLKFRTMVVNAEALQRELEHLNEAGGPVFKIKDDPRITSIGKFLRRTSLDELPQLLNVLKGDMSLVGPRPLPLRDYEGFDQDWHRRRFSVRPGITCLWQIGGRSSVTFNRWMELDMEYIDRWSLWLDLKILFATLPAVLKQRGAV